MLKKKCGANMLEKQLGVNAEETIGANAEKTRETYKHTYLTWVQA